MDEAIAREIRDRVDALPEREVRDPLAECVVRIVEDHGDDVIDLRSTLISRFVEPDEIELIRDGDDWEGTLDANEDACRNVREQCQAHERELSEPLVEPTAEEASSVET